MNGMLLAPMDTLFFRDGTPFSAGSASQDDVGGLFPPPPTTVAGALRASLARCNGWTGRGRWPREIIAVLGDGPEDLGKLSFDGPFVVRGGRPLFPVPTHLLGTTGEQGDRRSETRRVWRPRVLLRPGSAVVCDLGDEARLPTASSTSIPLEELKTGAGSWLTRPGMEAVLRGELPPESAVVSSRELWSEERRIGLERDRTTRTAREGMLYGTRHVRLEGDVALGLRVAGVPQDWKLPYSQMVPLGGESRVAECAPWDGDLMLDAPLAAAATSGRLLVVALTPLDLDEQVCRGEATITSLGDARVISACLSRPQGLGGWDSLARRPVPLRRVLPAGSVLFCEIAAPRRFLDLPTAIAGPRRVGARQPSGFGAVALGVWPNESEMTT